MHQQYPVQLVNNTDTALCHEAQQLNSGRPVWGSVLLSSLAGKHTGCVLCPAPVIQLLDLTAVHRLLPVGAAAAAGKGASSGVGFAIPVDTVKGLVDQILQYGRVIRPSLGVVIAPPQALQRIGEKGVLVLDVSHLG